MTDDANTHGIDDGNVLAPMTTRDGVQCLVGRLTATITAGRLVCLVRGDDGKPRLITLADDQIGADVVQIDQPRYVAAPIHPVEPGIREVEDPRR